MPNILLIDKSGEIKSENYKKLLPEDLYKKCGYRKIDNFEEQVKWKNKSNNEQFIVKVFGKKVGKHNMENKYEFPPPIDTTLLFGTVCLVNFNDNDEIIDLSKEQWEKLYEKLFGGFEDLNETGEDDENEEDELDNISPSKNTKTGYLKD